ncbi:MAG: hypothetical protein JO359_10975 [Candidatus Eremiobacteraeota bacterium]|nr:hypothetical protein [Candidatus Eremiobacteraeota bacterium]
MIALLPFLAAALAPAGLYAPASAANVLAVQALDAGARPAAVEIVRELAASRTLRGIAIESDPSSSDCSAKPYAAAARLASSVQRAEEGWRLELGLYLVDCAGWSVNEWHNEVLLAHPALDGDFEKLGLAVLLRLRTWIHEEPVVASALFRQGLAYDPATAKPTYFYTLFKTNDGYMRAYVRPGGPAYIAGMRTNDIVDKVDGKWWWEYGTYQTQQRAYDGLPHTFEITRGKTTVKVALGEPFTP